MRYSLLVTGSVFKAGSWLSFCCACLSSLHAAHVCARALARGPVGACVRVGSFKQMFLRCGGLAVLERGGMFERVLSFMLLRAEVADAARSLHDQNLIFRGHLQHQRPKEGAALREV